MGFFVVSGEGLVVLGFFFFFLWGRGGGGGGLGWFELRGLVARRARCKNGPRFWGFGFRPAEVLVFRGQLRGRPAMPGAR